MSEEELFERLKARGRADDTEEVIRNRMKVYRDETAPLLEYYSDNDLQTVDAVGALDEVFARALRALGQARPMIALPGLRNRKVVAAAQRRRTRRDGRRRGAWSAAALRRCARPPSPGCPRSSSTRSPSR